MSIVELASMHALSKNIAAFTTKEAAAASKETEKIALYATTDWTNVVPFVLESTRTYWRRPQRRSDTLTSPGKVSRKDENAFSRPSSLHLERYHRGLFEQGIFSVSLLAAAAPLVVNAAISSDKACIEAGSTMDTSTRKRTALSSIATVYRDGGPLVGSSLQRRAQTAVCRNVRSLLF